MLLPLPDQAKEGKADLPPEMAHVKDVDELVEHADGFAEVRICPKHDSAENMLIVQQGWGPTFWPWQGHSTSSCLMRCVGLDMLASLCACTRSNPSAQGV